MHSLLYYPVFAASIFINIEMIKRDCWVIGCARVVVIMLHGTWMAQVASLASYVVLIYNHSAGRFHSLPRLGERELECLVL